ncbi:unnamed protein product, partial [marine sediment metagenome]
TLSLFYIISNKDSFIKLIDNGELRLKHVL